jgi:hypothetical protein
MNPKQLEKLAKDPRFISGIYNYCDRWCERCPFTSRCLNFAMEQAENLTEEERDSNNQAFWDHLHNMLQETMQMIQEDAAKSGIDLNDPSLEAEILAQERRLRREEIKNQRLPKAAMAYAKLVSRWMDAAKPDFKAKGIELATEARLEIGRPRSAVAAIQDFVDVIRWYQHFIYIKLCRAISSQCEEAMKTDPEMGSFPRDSEGTAKVVLIAIDRSIAAWAGLREIFPQQEDAILDLLQRLGQLRTGIEAMFPDARKFVRPGFDTEPAGQTRSA